VAFETETKTLEAEIRINECRDSITDVNHTNCWTLCDIANHNTFLLIFSNQNVVHVCAIEFCCQYAQFSLKYTKVLVQII